MTDIDSREYWLEEALKARNICVKLSKEKHRAEHMAELWKMCAKLERKDREEDLKKERAATSALRCCGNCAHYVYNEQRQLACGLTGYTGVGPWWPKGAECTDWSKR